MNFNKKINKTSHNKSFDVIICTKNRHFFLKKSLNAIMNNNILPNKLILVDQNYSDTSIKYAKKVFADYKFKNFFLIKNLKNICLTYSKNLGLKLSTSKIIFFLDDDIIIDKFFFKNSIETLINEQCHGVSGVVVNHKKNYLNDLFYHFFNFYEFRDNRKSFNSEISKFKSKEAYHLPGGITCYKSSVLNRIRFDDILIRHHYEDVDFNYRLKKQIKKLKLKISFKSKAIDQLLNINRTNNKRIFYMRLVYLKHKCLKFIFVYYLSLTGLILLNLSQFNFNFFVNLFNQIKSADKKYKSSQFNYK